MTALTVSLLLACSGNKQPAEPAAEAAQPTAADDVVAAAVAPQEEASADGPSIDPSDEGYAVYRALSVRDPEPACAEVESLTPTPVQTLLEVIDRAQQPPWAGMRAANCLIQGHGEEIADSLGDWVSADDTKGLALLVLDQLDSLPEALALEVAGQALAGPHADDATSRIAKSTRPALQALVQ